MYITLYLYILCMRARRPMGVVCKFEISQGWVFKFKKGCSRNCNCGILLAALRDMESYFDIIVVVTVNILCGSADIIKIL